MNLLETSDEEKASERSMLDTPAIPATEEAEIRRIEV
jgi:hypothetical protein